MSAATAANPACDPGFVQVLVHTAGTESYRAKACWAEVPDNWQYQDTYVDGWSAIFGYPRNSLTGDNLTAKDTDGANNGWKTIDSEYPEGHELTISLCSYDFSAGVAHGCTGAGTLVS